MKIKALDTHHLSKLLAVFVILLQIIAVLPSHAFGEQASDVIGEQASNAIGEQASDVLREQVSQVFGEQVSDIIGSQTSQVLGSLISDILGNQASDEIVTLEDEPVPIASADGTTKSVIPSNDFDDVLPSDWFYNDVIEASKAGLVQGMGSNLYKPASTITYGEFITGLVRILQAETPNLSGSRHWADKYVFAARSLGIVDSKEAVLPDAKIPRQEMIRYSVKALELKISTNTSPVFADVKAADSLYINTAYEEYLTEGGGRNASGLKIFGYGRTGQRSEMATMLNRVYQYKANTISYKTYRSLERVDAEKAYIDSLPTIWNGYTIPKNYTSYVLYTEADIKSGKDFSGSINCSLEDALKEGLQTMTALLSSKLNPTYVKAAIDYARTKVFDVNGYGTVLDKSFPAGGKYYIRVTSTGYQNDITFEVYVP